MKGDLINSPNRNILDFEQWKLVYKNISINTKMNDMNRGVQEKDREWIVSWTADVFNNLPDSLFSAKIDWLMD